MGEIKVRAVEFEEKSAVEIEEQLLKEHEEKQNSVQEVIDDKPEVVEEQPADEIDEQKVLSFLGKKLNKEVSSFDELIQPVKTQEELDAEVEAFWRYKKETGRGMNDFIKLNKDYNNEDPDKILYEYYREQNDQLDDEDIRFELETKFSYDADFDDEKEIRKKQLEKKKELKKAQDYFNNLKEQYKVPLESRESFVPSDEKESYESFKQYKSSQEQMAEEQAKKSKYFAEKTSELFSDKFEGFKFSLDESKSVTYKPAESTDLLKQQSDLTTFVSKFVNEDGYLKDAELFHRAIAVASNPEKFAKFFYEKGMADAVTDVVKESKNIDMTRGATQITPKEGFQVRAVEPDSGSRLVIKNKFKS